MNNSAMISRRSFCAALMAGAGLLLTACSGAASSSTSSSAPASSPASSGASSAASSGVAGDWLLSADEYPRVDGSTACIPLMAAMMHETTGIPLEDAQSGITVSTTGYAWENISISYSTEYPESNPELLIVYEAPQYVQDEIAEAGIELETTAIGLDALVFMVNDSNPVQSLTRQQLIDIYAGKITNWKDVGGEDTEIIAFQRSEDSGSQTLFKKLLMGDVEPAAAPTELAPTEMGELVDALASYNNAGNAIGFSVYYYIDQMYSKPGLRLLAVDDVTPANATIADGTYPLPNPFYAVIRTDTAEDAPARTLYGWITGPEGKACIEGAGYVPANT